MSIADKLNYLNTTKTNIKEAINLSGANITDDTFRSYADKIKNSYLEVMNNGWQPIWNNWDKVSGTGTTLSLNNTEEAPMSLIYKGNTKQQTYSGKNKLPYTADFTETKNGTTFTGSKGVYTIQTTPSTNTLSTKINLINNYTIQSGDYLHMMNDVAANTVTLDLCFTDNTKTSSAPTQINRIVDLTEFVGKTINAISFFAATSYNGTKITLSPMIVNSSTATSYEPYVGGQPSPNPDFPQEVRNVKDNINLQICNKNVFNINGTIDSANEGYTIQNNILTVPATSGAFGILAFSKLYNGGNYYFSYKKLTGDDVRVLIRVYDSNNNIVTNATISGFSTYNSFYQGYYQNSTTGMQINVSSNYSFRICFVYINYSINDIQLEQGDTPTNYVEHQEQNINITLPEGIELCKIGTYQDYIHKSGDKWYKHKAIGTFILNGTENWYSLDTSPNRYYTNSYSSILSGLVTTDALSTHFIFDGITSNITNNNHFWFNKSTSATASNGNLSICYDDISTVADLETWLSNNNVTILYGLATPIEEEITDTTLLSQLEALKKSYENVTNISQVNNDLASELNITALQKA